jgi:hypothetical protein
MYVPDVEAVERGATGTGSSTTLGGASSTVLLCLCKLGDDGNTLQLLARQLQCLGDRLFVLELDIADAGGSVSKRSLR